VEGTTVSSFYEPTAEHIEKLSQPWVASFSGGKDSTTMVVWVEWLRRAGRIVIDRPRLVRSDTGVEEQNLVGIAEELTALLEKCGWECAVVRPEVHERLYNQILGRGLPPIHPGVRHMRWCTRSTKIDPMGRHKDNGDDAAPLSITGLRLGESAMRDSKLKKLSVCAAGGECGIPEPGEGRYSPILHWQTCHVFDWLDGLVNKEIVALMSDVFAVTKRLVEVYGVQRAATLFDYEEVVSTARFGCIGCPAIGAEASPPRSVVRRNGEGSSLNELYAVWYEARKPENRLVWVNGNGKAVMGPIKLEVRKRLFERIMDIQRRAGVVLIIPEDEAFIRRCWENKVYPRYWSEDDELTEVPPEEMPLFDGK
jgi:DNA sulfur modification protein DndC